MSCIEIAGTTGAGHTANPMVSQAKTSSSITEIRSSKNLQKLHYQDLKTREEYACP